MAASTGRPAWDAPAPPEGVEDQRRPPPMAKRIPFVEQALAVNPRRPVSVRQLFYRALKFGYPKNPNAYKRFDEAVVKMREEGDLPWSDIVDPKRTVPYRTSSLNRSAKEAVELALTGLAPLSSVWGPLGLRPQLWVESTGMAAAVEDIADDFEVAVWCSSGHSSLTLLWECGQRRPTHLGILADHDTSGFHIRKNIISRTRQFHPNLPAGGIQVEWLAVRPEQIDELDLEHSYLPAGEEPDVWPPVQLDAMDEDVVIGLVEAWLLSLLPPDTWEPYKEKRAGEQDKVDALVKTIRDDYLDDLDEDDEEDWDDE